MGLRSRLAGLGPSSHCPLGGCQPLRLPLRPPPRPVPCTASLWSTWGSVLSPDATAHVAPHHTPIQGSRLLLAFSHWPQHGSWSGWSLDCATLRGDGASGRSGQPEAIGAPQTTQEPGGWGTPGRLWRWCRVSGTATCHHPLPSGTTGSQPPSATEHLVPPQGLTGLWPSWKSVRVRAEGGGPQPVRLSPPQAWKDSVKKGRGLCLAVSDKLFLLTVLVPCGGGVLGACSGSGWDGCPWRALHHCSAIFATILRV